MEKRELIVYDVCGTLTSTNNTKDFISFVIKNNLPKILLFNFLLLFSKYFLKLTNSNKAELFFRKTQIRFLKNYSKDYLDKKASEYLDWLIKKNKFKESILNQLKSNKNKGKEVLLVSAAINPPIQAIANYLEVKFYSTKLEYTSNKCTGKISEELYSNKQDLFKKKAIDLNKYSHSKIISDNSEDNIFFSYFDKVNFLKNNNRLNLKKINPDFNSINEKNKNFVYLPFFYYLLSRLHFKGFFETFLLRQLLPYSIIFSILLKISPLDSIIFNFITLTWFYSLYEIGSLFNDLKSRSENQFNSTHRIKLGIKINKYLFISTRTFASVVFFIIFMLNYTQFWSNLILFVIGSISTIIFHLVHTQIKSNLKIFTFVLLRFFRTATPLIFLLGFVNWQILIELIVTLFILFSMKSIYYYYYSKQNKLNKKNKNLILIGSYLITLTFFLISNELIIAIIIAYFTIIIISTNLFNKSLEN